MMQRFSSPIFAAFMLFFAVFATPASAGKGDASVFLENLAQEAIAVMSDRTISEETRERAFRNLIHRGFDFPKVSRFVLGRHWRTAAPAERAEFMRLFADFIVGTYAQRLGGYSGERLQIVDERTINRNGVQVSSRIERPGKTSVNVAWRLSRRDGEWRIVDVVVEGVSLAIVQRAEFDAALSDFAASLESLRGHLPTDN